MTDDAILIRAGRVESHWRSTGRARNSVWTSAPSVEPGLTRSENVLQTLLTQPDVVQLAVANRPEQPAEPAPLGGRLLVFAPEDSLTWGLAEQFSDGLFNWEDCPGWDLWLGWLPSGWCRRWEPVLLCYVPEELVSAAARGMEADPIQPFEWADQSTELLSEVGRKAAGRLRRVLRAE